MQIVGMCPNCANVVTVNKKALLVACEDCGHTASLRQAVAVLQELCEDPTAINNVIDIAFDMNEKDNSEIALSIITLLKQYHPYNEEAMFAYVYLSGYGRQAVREYLNTFSQVKSQKVWAEEFIERLIQLEFMFLHTQIAQFITAKFPPAKQREYMSRLDSMKQEYTKGAKFGQTDGMISMYALYIIGTALNIGMIVLLLMTDFMFIINVLIAFAVFTVEIGALFIHNRIFGNRLGMSENELFFLVMFLASICAGIGGVIIASLVSI